MMNHCDYGIGIGTHLVTGRKQSSVSHFGESYADGNNVTPSSWTF